MQMLSLLTAALVGLAQAVEVQVVYVGMNPATNTTKLAYFPEKITAAPGSMVQFQFLAGKHTVTQSNFDNPCIPIGNVNASATGIFSGSMDVAAAKAQGMLPTFTVMVNDTKPIWLYCTTGPHCANGMSMVINENVAANSSRSLENYKALASTFTGTSPQPNHSGSDSGSGSPSSAPGNFPATTSAAGSQPSTLATSRPGSTSTNVPAPVSTIPVGAGSAVSVSVATMGVLAGAVGAVLALV